ncbi:MAG: serine--tRNA ligase, partial [Patescibacteria group bacterium]
LLQIDETRLETLSLVENLRAEQNKISDKVAGIKVATERETLIKEMRVLKEHLKQKEDELKEILKKWQKLMLEVPNVPDMSVPDGASEDDNAELKTWGKKPEFSFETKSHIELMQALDMADLERGTKVHGFRGYFLKNDGARLSWAIWNYAMDFFGAKNFIPFIVPTIVRKEHFYGTGHLPSGADDLYVTQDGDYLSGTAEVPMMAFHSNETLLKNELPKRYLAFSPCYRREAGSHGKDAKGLIRVHEFYKLEQLILCEASHAESVKFHEEMNRNTEEFIESLKLPYRQIAISTGDLKSAHVKSYDTELWIPSENRYREIASASYYHDFQSRRFNIRYNDGGVKQYVHSLNATAIPTPRVLVAIVENFQEEDGSIRVPEALQPYLGKSIIKKI